MTKRVELTDTIKQYITEKCGTDIDYSKFVLYQTRSLSTEPVRKEGSIYDKAVFTRNALVEMQEMSNDPKLNISLQLLHDTHSIPYGRVIHSNLVDEDDMTSALYTLFMLSTEHEDLINKIDNGILDEVSTNTLPRKALCSECGKDFMDDDVDIMSFIEGRCPECGAIMGKDGAHLNIPSVESFMELSLVPRGAAKNPKILDSVYQLAMSNSDSVVLTKAQVKSNLTKLNLISTISEEVDMNPEDLKAALSAATEPLVQEVRNMQTTLASLTAEKDTLEAAKSEAESAKAALEEEKASLVEEKAKLEADLAEKSAAYNEMAAAFDAEIKKVLVASGTPEASIPSDLKGKQELLSNSRLTLANIPVGGVSRGADFASVARTNSIGDLSAYKVK